MSRISLCWHADSAAARPSTFASNVVDIFGLERRHVVSPSHFAFRHLTDIVETLPAFSSRLSVGVCQLQFLLVRLPDRQVTLHQSSSPSVASRWEFSLGRHEAFPTSSHFEPWHVDSLIGPALEHDVASASSIRMSAAECVCVCVCVCVCALEQEGVHGLAQLAPEWWRDTPPQHSRALRVGDALEQEGAPAGASLGTETFSCWQTLSSSQLFAPAPAPCASLG